MVIRRQIGKAATANVAYSITSPSCWMLSLVALSYFIKDENDDTMTMSDSTNSTTSSTSRCQCQGSSRSNNHTHPSTDLTHFAPTLPIYVFRPNPHLEIAFDVRTRNPVYVLERLPAVLLPVDNTNDNKSALEHYDMDVDNDNADESGSSSPQEGRRRRRRPNFYEEASLPEMFRSRNGHYRYSGYDRGHLAPAADFMGGNYQLLQDTFNLCNVSPQDPALNRMLWAQLELWTRQVAQREWKQRHNMTLVLTGPLWLPSVYHPPSSSSSTTPSSGTVAQLEYRYPAIGQPPSLLSVPTHFFKVVVVVASEGTASNLNHRIEKFACFVVPNQKLDENCQLADYLVRWSDLEAVVGMHLFPQLAQPTIVDMADALTDGVGELVMKSRGTASSSHRLLLLPEDGSSALVSKRPYKGNARNRPTLEHLCARGSCR